jgi:hypothetical protein
MIVTGKPARISADWSGEGEREGVRMGLSFVRQVSRQDFTPQVALRGDKYKMERGLLIPNYAHVRKCGSAIRAPLSTLHQSGRGS